MFVFQFFFSFIFMCINDTMVKSTAVSALNNAQLAGLDLPGEEEEEEKEGEEEDTAGLAELAHVTLLQLSLRQLRRDRRILQRVRVFLC